MDLVVDSHPGGRRVLGAGVDGTQYLDVVVDATPRHNGRFGRVPVLNRRVGEEGSAFGDLAEVLTAVCLLAICDAEWDGMGWGDGGGYEPSP